MSDRGRHAAGKHTAGRFKIPRVVTYNPTPYRGRPPRPTKKDGGCCPMAAALVSVKRGKFRLARRYALMSANLIMHSKGPGGGRPPGRRGRGGVGPGPGYRTGGTGRGTPHKSSSGTHRQAFAAALGFIVLPAIVVLGIASYLAHGYGLI